MMDKGKGVRKDLEISVWSHAEDSDASYREEQFGVKIGERNTIDTGFFSFEMPVKHSLVGHRSMNMEVRFGLQAQGIRL